MSTCPCTLWPAFKACARARVHCSCGHQVPSRPAPAGHGRRSSSRSRVDVGVKYSESASESASARYRSCNFTSERWHYMRARAQEIARTSGGLYSVWRLLRSPGTRSPACRLCMPVLQLTTRSSRTLCRRAPSDGHDTSTAQQARSKAQGAGAQAAAAHPHSGRAKHPPGGGSKHPPACVRAPPLQRHRDTRRQRPPMDTPKPQCTPPRPQASKSGHGDAALGAVATRYVQAARVQSSHCDDPSG